jgi:MFS transporter, DHA1 family, multidrug resistance protein
MSVEAAPIRAQSRGETIGMVAALIAINAAAIDIMLPGLQQIGASLGEPDENRRQFVITAYLIGFGLMQIVFGPLSDRFGRRKPLMVGLAIYIAAASAALFVQSFEGLLLLRLLQGVGGAASVVIGIAFVRDQFEGPRMAEVMSFVMMVFLITPVIAPAIGQGIISLGDWHYVFTFMGGLAAFVFLWLVLRMPETLDAAKRRPFTPGSIVDGFGIVFSNRIAMFYILGTAFILGALFGFINSAQQIYVGVYGLGTWFPLAFGAVAAFMALGSFINGALVGRFGMRRMSHTALTMFFLLALILAILAWLGPVPFPVFIALFGGAMFFFSWIGSNFGALALEPLGHVAGTAASAQGAIQVVIGAVLGAFIGQSFDGGVLPIALGFVGLSLLSLICVLIAEKGRLFGAPPAG